jgi:hypothetical protein
MKQVSREQFWQRITRATFDILSSVEPGPYPYTSAFKTRDGLCVGKIIARYENPGKLWPVVSVYFLS